MPRFLVPAAIILVLGSVASAAAQPLPGVSGTLGGRVAVPSAPAYGYQPYNPGNPRGFDHPNQMGYGAYHNPTRLEGHRSSALHYRRFKGY